PQLLAGAGLDVGGGVDHALERSESALRAGKTRFERVNAGEAWQRLAAAVHRAGVVIVAVRWRAAHTLSAGGIAALCAIARSGTHDRRVDAGAGDGIAAVVRALVGVDAVGGRLGLAGAIHTGGRAAGAQRVTVDIGRAWNAGPARV